VSEDSKKGKGRLRDRLGGLSVGDAAELLVLARQRIREAPVEHAKAAADVTRSLSEARSQLPGPSFQAMRRAVLLVARRDWAAAAILADALTDLVREHPDSVDWVGEAVARAVQADRTLARQLARVLPECATRVPDRGPRLRIVTALADLCRRHPGLGLAALPTVRLLLREGSAEGLATFLEEALGKAARSESVARSFLLRESRAGQEAWASQREGLALTEVARTLQLYAEAHLGRGILVRSTADLPEGMALPDGALAVTDGRQIFLPPRIDRFDDDETNFRLYKVATAHEVGRMEFGTFDLRPLAVPGIDPIDVFASDEEPGSEDPEDANPVLVFASRFPDSGLARRLFLFAEDLRVDACLRREYPGLARDLDSMAEADLERRPDIDRLQDADLLIELLARWLWFGEPLPEGDAFRRFREASLLLQALRHPGAGVQDSAGATVLLYGLVGGDGQPGEAGGPKEELVGLAAAESRRAEGGDGHGQRSGEGDGVDVDVDGPTGQGQEDPTGPGGSAEPLPGGRIFSGDVIEDVARAERETLMERARIIQRALEARGMSVSLREITAALEVDPELPDRTLERNLLEAFRESMRRGEHDDDAPTGQGLDVAGVRVARYPEWDEQIGDYRPRWCSVWERRASGDASAFVESVLDEHGPMVRRLRREFQMLRPAGMGRERRAREGDELDLDALVEDLVDRRAGLPSDERIYLRRHLKQRDVAVAFLVDLSASTRELVGQSGKSVIEVEKESLVMMSEALEALGDRYAIFGFSGRGRQMVTFDVFKDFDEPLDHSTRGRIGAMNYRMENRDGAAIRHATGRLLAVDARTRLLILLSDGKPLDCGCDLYQGSYAQADTVMALREAMEQRVHPFCITVDPSGEDYLREMYGEVRYAVIDSVAALPERLPAIYRRLTT
jgi:nitric oxide reductase NorD protein